MKYSQSTTKIKILIVVISLITSYSWTQAQELRTISGTILAPDGIPVENASVSVEGSFEMPVLTNEAGEFSLKVPENSNWILVSPTGDLKTKRVYIADRQFLEVTLTSKDLISGDDPVRFLSHTLRRDEVVASFIELDMENTEHSPALSFDQFLQGRVAGLNVVNRSGHPASGALLTLRGVNSLYANNEPLIIVDGIPLASQNLFNSKLDGYSYNPLLGINMFDISKTIVVKDPTITAAYGSKASNGIIFIETLDPSVSQTTIDIDYRNGFTRKPGKEIPQLNAAQHRSLISEILFSSPLMDEEIVEIYPNLFLEETDDRYIDYQHDTIWQKLIFDDAWMTNFNIKVKGGDEIARYGLSFGYVDANGIIKNTSYQGYNLRFVSLLNIFTWLKMDAGVSLNYSLGEMKEASTVKETSPILTSLSKSPMLNPYQYDLEGNELILLSEVDELGVSNPLATIENYQAKNSNYNFTANLGLTADINRNIFVKSKFSLNYNVLKESIFMPNKGMELYYNKEAINVAKLTNNSLNSLYNNTYLNYSQLLGDKHRVQSSTGINIQVNKYQYDWGLTKNAHQNDQYRMIQDGLNNLREIGGANKNWNWLSFYEYINYAYDNKYLASASVSLDGSSRVGDNAANTINLGVPFGLFYSGGLAWRISQESFMQNLTWLDDLKLRVSAGKVGNDDLGEASATNYYLPVKFNQTVGLYPGSVPNEALTYETITELNAGIDISTAGNRFNISLDIYHNTSNDLLNYYPIESYMGYNFRIQNYGSIQNSGIEIYTFYRILDKGSFKWDLSASLTSNNNTVLNLEGNTLSYDIPGGEKVNMDNEEANSFYGYIYEGVYATQSEAEEAGLVNDKNSPYMAGDAIYRDISGPGGIPDSVINFYDKTSLGSALPKYFGGLQTRLTYNRLALDIHFQFVYGNEIFNYVRYKNENLSTLNNQSVATLNRWQYDGHQTDVPRAEYNDIQGNNAFSSRWIEDGSYARIKLIAFSYRIPDEFLAFKNAEFYISVTNLLTLSNYLGYYPEFSYSHSQIHRGVDYGQTPQSMQFIAGIRLGL